MTCRAATGLAPWFFVRPSVKGMSEATPEIVEVAQTAPEAQEAQVAQEEPPTPKPKRAPRKKAAPRPTASPQEAAPFVADANFWNELLSNRRELDRVAKNTRFANLVKFK